MFVQGWGGTLFYVYLLKYARVYLRGFEPDLGLENYNGHPQIEDYIIERSCN